jgi:cytochrome P450
MRPYTAPGPRGRAAARILAGFAFRPLGCYRELAAYGDAVELSYAPGRRLFVLSRPAFVEHILAKNQDNYVKAFTYRPLRAVLGDGLVTSEGGIWRRHRRVVQPMFSRRQVAGFAPQMRAGVRYRIEAWDALPDGSVVEMAGQLSTLTLDVVGRALFGSELVAKTSRMVPAMRRMQKGVSLASFFPYLWTPAGTRRIVRATRGFWGTLDAIDAPVRELIARRRTASKPGDDLLGLLMAARDEDGSQLSDDEVRDEATTFMLAGHETTAVALGWSLALLSAYPAARERLEAEADAAPDELGAEDIDKLAWTQAVVSEAMRLYPPAWTIERDALADDEIDDVRIPAGSTVATPPFLVHRHPDTWPNPEGFDPTRFLNGEERHRYAYIPFGGGRRACVGAGFAQLEAVLVLAAIARRYRFDLIGGMPLPATGVTLRPGTRLPMRLTRRS